ncbi:putative F-box domain, galactose oxidase/kelch, beta-propeller, F-box associated interaction [Medicago truncatula]|uniref:Putative F-box domain, galactose oxidase/kelch, beta-propeller, F-box associated interaction n=1 Tax=Medicago truncatula TaxID=3880 RepID=A0A396HHQ9_MEDTR|nr:F-box/kelch-repeat protein At3g23880 [Medicago truncatula]RHN52061.1 putative F-box domain, galactose oxidase/kelch, beta-propeller, F-box associated interaction [Medicago truncatula]
MEKNPQYLPQELIILILLRLPVMSLLRFKCVCKLLFSLISQTHFAISHFEITAAHNPRILFMSNPDLETRLIDFETSLSDYYTSTSLNLNFMRPRSDPRRRPLYCNFIETKCSCRGFIFLHHDSNIYLWNPSTRVHKQIPLSPNSSYLGVNYICYLYGFGYDPSTDDYLVVVVSCDTDFHNFSSQLEFFSLRDNRWKEIEGTPFPYMNTSDYSMVGSVFNGAIHWLAFRHDLSMKVIIAFDLIERKLFDMSLPDDMEHEPIYCDLWVFGEFLSVWTMDSDIVEIWVMKEYKVHSSWTKTLTFSIDDIPTRYFSPICCTKSGDIIGTDGTAGLVRYDENGQFLEYSSYCIEDCGSRVAVYTESLLSLPDDNDQD